MARINPEQIRTRLALNKLSVDLIVDLTLNGSTLTQYEEADRIGFLLEVNQELQVIDCYGRYRRSYGSTGL